MKEELYLFSRFGCTSAYYCCSGQTRSHADWVFERSQKGYDVRELIETIGTIIDSDESMNVAVIGIGNLGRAVAGYFKVKGQN